MNKIKIFTSDTTSRHGLATARAKTSGQPPRHPFFDTPKFNIFKIHTPQNCHAQNIFTHTKNKINISHTHITPIKYFHTLHTPAKYFTHTKNKIKYFTHTHHAHKIFSHATHPHKNISHTRTHHARHARTSRTHTSRTSRTHLTHVTHTPHTRNIFTRTKNKIKYFHTRTSHTQNIFTRTSHTQNIFTHAHATHIQHTLLRRPDPCPEVAERPPDTPPNPAPTFSTCQIV